MYSFVREDDGNEVEVDFETMMGKDCMGYITLEDGVRAKEPATPLHISTGDNEENQIKQTEYLSDAMGFPDTQFEEFEADRKLMGFSGIEFEKEKDMPFYQVKGQSGAEWNRYMKHRGFFDRNRHDGGYTPSKKELDDATKLANRTK